MENKDEKYLILEQYRIYSEGKDKFIDRQFASNRFFLVVNLVVLAAITFVGQYVQAFVLGIIGTLVSIMWWINIDSYQQLIKVKYAKVLEFLETKLPEQPYHKEYADYMEMKKGNNLIIFGDFQKFLAFIIICVYFTVLIWNAYNFFMSQFKMF